MNGAYVTHAKTNNTLPIQIGCGILRRKPQNKLMKNDRSRVESNFENLDLCGGNSMLKRSNGPHAHHSPQIDAGEATLSTRINYKC